MNEETVVAVYDTAVHAQAAVSDLRAANVPESAISVHADGATGGSMQSGATGAGLMQADSGREQGFWASLFGGEPDHDTSVYDRSVQGGSSVVTVRVPEAQVGRVTQILENHSPIDIDDRATGYGLTQTTTTQTPIMPPPVRDTMGTTSTAGTTGTPGTIQLSEEQIAIGKRVVNRGGTRIRRFVVEVPVEEQVTLRDEKVTLERRPVMDGRPATDSFSDKAIEMTATSEEAVVSKTARVVEEVGLRREATERVETIRDTVRKEDVKVEQLAGNTDRAAVGKPVLPKI